MLGPLTIYSQLTFFLFQPFWTHTESVFWTVSTISISTTRPSWWSPRCIIFSTSFFAHFLDTASRLGLRATLAVLRFFTLFISPDSFFRARDDAWDHFSLSLGTISTLCPDILLPQCTRHIGRHQIVPYFLHEPSTPVILQMFRYFATIHSPRKEAHQCSPPPSVLVIISIPWLNTSSLPDH